VTRRAIGGTIAAIFLVAAILRADPSPGLSHLRARSIADSLSHLNAHRPGLPPPALLVPLGNGTDGVLKGVTLADEARLADALARRNLVQVVLRVGSARVDGRRMGLIKLQAGTRAGDFSVGDLRGDAAACMSAAFDGKLRLDHLDLWSVVPGARLIGDQQEHLPVFSLSVSRGQHSLLVSEVGGDGPEVLDRLAGVRYDPLFARYARDGEALQALPEQAFTDPALAESWADLLAEARARPARLAMAGQDEVEAIFTGSREGNLVALTIDDGPHPLITPLMLEILAREGVRATFFVVGQKVEEFPALAMVTAAAGHELANHAYSNRRITQLPDAEAWAEVAACDRVVRRATGERMRWFRPPGGRCSPGGLRAVAALGYTTAFWSRNTGDWRKPPPEEIVRNATEGLQPGDIILMHQGDMCSVRALPGIIDRIRAMGLEPTTLARLAEAGGVIARDPRTMSRMVNGRLGQE